ncbi:PPA1309 family protein [Actinomadura atramentaria]|uniref:PPA1309 family protein n=1 Tax=Actinomadura atramentaria TaxID=1990 RepID=UPI00036CE93F|nr:PPA1309 family protein [Actinomadura atramentaria]
MNPLEDVVLTLERTIGEEGWDLPPRLYALVPAAELRAASPDLAAEIGLDPAADQLVLLEQPDMPAADSLEESLATIVWPDAVAGCAIALERVVLPPAVEDDIPDDADEAARWVAGHPAREDVRMIVGVLRDGTRHSALRFRRHAADDEVLHGDDLVPAVGDALEATLEPDEPDDPAAG